MTQLLAWAVVALMALLLTGALTVIAVLAWALPILAVAAWRSRPCRLLLSALNLKDSP